MKKIILSLTVMMMAVVTVAQTNFRHIPFEEAKAAAKAEKKLVFVDFYTSWCGPCKMMARDVFPQKTLGDYMNKTFVCVKYDAEKEEKALVERSKVNAYPTFVVFDAEGREVGRLVGGNTADGFMADLEMMVNPEKAPEKIKARYDAGERNAFVVSTYAALLRNEIRNSRRGDEQKEQLLNNIINDYFSSISDKQKLDKSNFFLYRDYIENTADEKMQFIFNNRNKVAKSDRADVDSIIFNMYKIQPYKCLSFSNPYNAEQTATLKKQFDELGLNANGEYTLCFAILEAHASGNMDEYLNQIQNNVPKMEERAGITALNGMDSALKDADQNVKNRAAKFLRNQFLSLSATEIYFLAVVLGKLEGTIGGH